jgi:hypothetical protein
MTGHKELYKASNDVPNLTATDRDAKESRFYTQAPVELTESEQLSFPFAQTQEWNNPKAVKKVKTKADWDYEYDETFLNFRTVLTGKDVSVEDKTKVLTTLLNNVKGNVPYLVNRSQALLVEIFVYGL